MKVLLLGANGYLGARLFYDLRDKHEVVGTYHKTQLFKDLVQLDITDKNQVQKKFETYKPDVVIQTANYPSPKQAAPDKPGYIQLNLNSTTYIREAADNVDTKVIFISSFAALNPDNIYGELKLKSEQISKKTKTGYLILRPSLILGFSPNTKNDRPFNRILRCLDSKTATEFDTSWQFQPTYIGHISDIIITALEQNISNHTVHVFCPAIETQYSTASDILRPFGIEVKPIDKNMNLPLQKRDERELVDLGLPTCSYKKMITNIHHEIRNRDKYGIK